MVRIEVAIGNRNRYWASLQVIAPAIPPCHRCSLYRKDTDIGMTIKVISKLEQARFAISKCVAALMPHFLQMTYIPRELPSSPTKNETAYNDVIIIFMLSVIVSLGKEPRRASWLVRFV